MRNIDYYKNKRVVIAGLGRSGLACANLLYDFCADVCVTDNQDTALTRLNASKLKSKQIKVELGRHSQGFIKERDLLIISPGVAGDAMPLIWAKEFNIPVISEIELAWDLCEGRVIAVTGSNGKTTVTTSIGKILEADSRNVFTCGNIGNPFAGEVDKIKANDFVSLEVSSFQLERINRFKPEISVILNFTRNHLDRYRGIEEYLKAKKRIFLNQDNSDYLVLNNDDPVVSALAKETRARVIYFRGSQNSNPNQAAVLAVGSILGIDDKLMLKVFKDFRGIEHRLEYVTRINNIMFINDSKATTADSALWALENIDSPIVLIAGGKHKGVDYSVILDLARKKVKAVILIGEAKKEIETAFKGFLPIDEAGTLKEAVYKAYLKASPGDCVLLSPMCSSFDMFSSFEERGSCFKRAVFDLTKEKSLYGAQS